MAAKGDFEFFLKTDLHEYAGKYVAIVDRKVVASGENVSEVWNEAVRKTGKEPLIAKVPTAETLILVL